MPLLESLSIGDQVYVELCPRIFRGTVTHLDDQIGVKSGATKYLGVAWQTLWFNADGVSMVGQARILQPQSLKEIAEIDGQCEDDEL